MLSGVGYTDDASAFHGAVCGALCVAAPDEVDVRQLLEDGTEDGAAMPATAVGGLVDLVEESLVALLSNEMSFSPLLPSDDVILETRVEALAAWCQGFLYGLSTARTLDLDTLSDESREVVSDLSELTRAGIDASDGDDTEEGAYAELVEYIRVGAQLIFMELHPRPDDDADPDAPPPTLH